LELCRLPFADLSEALKKKNERPRASAELIQKAPLPRPPRPFFKLNFQALLSSQQVEFKNTKKGS
jgi:hypothetical protein